MARKHQRKTKATIVDSRANHHRTWRGKSPHTHKEGNPTYLIYWSRPLCSHVTMRLREQQQISVRKRYCYLQKKPPLCVSILWNALLRESENIVTCDRTYLIKSISTGIYQIKMDGSQQTTSEDIPSNETETGDQTIIPLLGIILVEKRYKRKKQVELLIIHNTINYVSRSCR